MPRILMSAAIGAAAMYFFDPQAGRRRRARTRDKAEHAARKLRHAYDVTARDTRHRMMGLQAMGRRLLRRDEADDRTLVGRVRSVLGRYVSHPHAVEVDAHNGEVSLSGPILEHEVPALLKAVKGVIGVQRVSNQLVAHKEPGNVSSLQGGVPRVGQRFELLQANWSPAARLLVGILGAGLLMRGGFFGRIGGAALLARAATNLDFATLVGLGATEDGIEVQKTICVNAPVSRVFAFWAEYENFPRFMTSVRDIGVAGNRSHWVVRGPAGIDIEWTSELVRMEPDSVIEWRATPDSQVMHEGEVHFEPAGDNATRVTVRLCYVPPAGAVGHAVASLFGADPKSDMDADLMRMKSMIETGRVPHDAAQPA